MPAFPPDPVIEVYKKDIDRTLIRENLKLTVGQGFEKLMALRSRFMRRCGGPAAPPGGRNDRLQGAA